MKEYLKRKLAILSLALAKTEKSMLNQASDALGSNGAMEQTYHQGSVADSLLKGELTLPVKELRWRLYKILEASKLRTTHIGGYDTDGMPITETFVVDPKRDLIKIKADPFDDYPIYLVFNNDKVIDSTTDVFKYDTLKILEEDDSEGKWFTQENNINQNDVGDDGDKAPVSYTTIKANESEESKALGRLSFDDMVATMNGNTLLNIGREFKPKFEIEQYTKKLVIRKINDEEFLLEFYISKYPDEYNRKSRLLISEIKRLKNNPKSDIIEFDRVGFITDKTIGVNDGYEYEFKVSGFDKIIEFNGYYVVKFKSKILVDGKFIYDRFKMNELDERYKNKAPKNKKKI